jgi:hypothetical protein
MTGTTLTPSVQSFTRLELTGQSGGTTGKPANSTIVGNISTNSTRTLLDRYSLCWSLIESVSPGTRRIRGTLTEISKLLYLDHSPCSAIDHPVKEHNLCISQIWTSMKKDEMGRVFGLHESDDKCLQNYSQKNLKNWDHFGDLSIYERIIIKWILNK